MECQLFWSAKKECKKLRRKRKQKTEEKKKEEQRNKQRKTEEKKDDCQTGDDCSGKMNSLKITEVD